MYDEKFKTVIDELEVQYVQQIQGKNLNISGEGPRELWS